MKSSDSACRLIDERGGDLVATGTKGTAFEFDGLYLVVGDRNGKIAIYTTASTPQGRSMKDIVDRVSGATIAKIYPWSTAPSMSGFANRNLPKNQDRVLIHFGEQTDLCAFLHIAVPKPTA